jgi:hypothetical protein
MPYDLGTHTARAARDQGDLSGKCECSGAHVPSL